MKCEDNPPEVEFADVEVVGTSVGSVAVYTSQPGYSSTGSNSSACTVEGWQIPRIVPIPHGE